MSRTLRSMLQVFRAPLRRSPRRNVPSGSKITSLLPRFTTDSRANVAIIFALTLIPITFAAGMGIDYTTAARRQTKLDAAADAAALAAVTPAMLSETASQAQTAAQNMFNAQASTISGVGSISLTAKVTQTTSNKSVTQTAVVTYTAQSATAFAGVIGQKYIKIAGSSTATASTAPNINFYVLADDSPSMAIPATTAGIDAMYTATSSGTGTGGDNEGGCSFACHESDTTKWVLPGNSSYPGTGTSRKPGYVDDYTYAEDILGLTLRIDNLRTAIENLASTSATTAASNKAAYQLAIYTFDTNYTSKCTIGSDPVNTIASLTSNMTTAQSEASNMSMLEAYNNNNLTSTCANDDGDTDIDDALSNLNSIMPTPGNGTSKWGDSPQEVLFFVTDGVEDYMNNGTRQISLLNTANCTAIKNRVSRSGLPIRIAVLYLNYLPIPSNSFYTANVEPFESDIGTTLQSCASPGLYQEVTTDQDISTALNTLFINAVNSAHLTD
ncbi:MAG: pilus assembly protein TadG-related protein [Methylovirgula sp.]